MATGLDIIKGAMRKIGAITKSEAPDDDEADDALNSLNAILSSWSNEANKVYARTTETFTTVNGTNTYSIGTGQTFNTTRPVKIITAYTREGTQDYPLEIITDENYATITSKSAGGRPYYLNYIASYPNGSIKLWPTPSAAYSLILVSEKELATVALATDIVFPPGWERALQYALAVDLAPEYGQQVDQTLYSIAQDAIHKIETGIMRTRSMEMDYSLTTDNIFTGYNNR